MFAGYFADRNGMDFTLYEASSVTGGNCRTIEEGNFHFDTGAHRLHAVDGELKKLYSELLGNDLLPVDAPSSIFNDDTFFQFPLLPLNILQNLNRKELWLSSVDYLKRRVSPLNGDDFRTCSINSYGDRIASKFLLAYSEKLWGVHSQELHKEVAGNRLKGLDLVTFLLEAFKTRKAGVRHLDGAFYYPANGIGQLFRNLQQSLPPSSIKVNSSIRRIVHNEDRLLEFELMDGTVHKAEQVISTLPLNVLLKALDPAPPEHIMNVLNDIRYRSLILVHIKLKKHAVTKDATIYFPSPVFSFTRVTEPRNRSRLMTPDGHTSLVAELPCFTDAHIWRESPEVIIDKVKNELLFTNLINENDIIGSSVHRVPFAYPVLKKDYKSKSEALTEYLSQFKNLSMAGRSGLFRYTHIHDHYFRSKEIVESIVKG